MNQQQEIEKLRKENANLKSSGEGANSQDSRHKKQSRISNITRKSSVIILVSAAVVLLTSANLLFWFGNTIVKPDRFNAATQPLIKDPAVQNALALYTTNSIFSSVDVQAATAAALPPRADFLAPQLTAQLKTFTNATLKKALARHSLQEKWNNVLARQHQRIINFASQYQGNGDISLNDVFNSLTASLSNTKLAFLADKQLPAKYGDIKIVSAPQLPAFHKLVTRIDTWRLLAVILLVVTLSAAVWLSRRRRLTIYIFSVATIVTMLATLLALHIVRDRIIGKIDPQYAEGVRQVIQIVFHSLVLQSITIMMAALFVGVVAWVSSTARSALWLKANVSRLFSDKIHSLLFPEEKEWTVWVHDHKRLIEWGATSILTVIILLARLSIGVLVAYAITLIVLILAIEIISGSNVRPVRTA